MSLPKPTGEFIWTQESWGPALRCAPLLEHAPHVFTTRGLALRGARVETADAWACVADAIDVQPGQLFRLRQVHGARVVEAHRSTLRAAPDEWPEADALISSDPAVGLVVGVADCVPLLLADPHSGAVGAVHAGWRGTAAGAAPAAVTALGRTNSTCARDLVAAIGPSIGPCCYIVGPELVDQFAHHDESRFWFGRRGDLHLDLWRATRDQLLGAGLVAENIHLAGLCTACHVDVFCSYRKEGHKTDRMAGAIRSATGDAARAG